MHNIVILGGNFAGSSIAHYLLRHVLPSLNSSAPQPEYKVILVSTSTHTFFKIGAPRAAFSDEILSPSKLFASIADGFSMYSPSEFEFVHGEVVGMKAESKKLNLKLPNGTTSTMEFGSLVIATGTTGKNNLWTMSRGGHEETLSAFENLHLRLKDAKTVMAIGGGAVGVETSGEIAFRGKKVTLVTNGTEILTGLKNRRVAKGAEDHLNALGVKVIFGTKTVSSTEMPDGSTEVVLSDGSKHIVDVLIDCTGGSPNTSFLPSSWLNERKYVVTEPTTLRATQAPQGIYSIGDVASYSHGNIPDAQWSVPGLGYSIWFDLKKDGMPVLKEKKYKQIQTDMMVVPIGPKGGVGALFGWKILNIMVWLIKGRTFMIENAPGVATGAMVAKA